MKEEKFVVWFSEVDKEDIPLAGGKGANLGEMVKIGVPVPPGFIVTAPAYFYFLEKNKLQPKIKQIFKGLDTNNPLSLAKVSQEIKKLILAGRIPPEISNPIMKSYLELDLFDYSNNRTKDVLKKLSAGFSQPLVAVRSSATAEDLPSASFAGQQVTFLNVYGEANVVEKVRECWASLFEPRAIFYRAEQGFDHFKVGIAVPVQKMIQSEASGVMFTIDPVTYEKKKITIEAIYGLGELIVQGAVIPDRYEVDKESLDILKKKVCRQEKMLTKKGLKNVTASIPRGKQNKEKLTNQEIKELALWGKKIEKHYYFPQDIEWAKESGKIYILQTRPVTTIEDRRLKIEDRMKFQVPSPKFRVPILKGEAASPGIATGPVKVIHSVREIKKVRPGEVLVAPQTSPDFVPVMRKVVAIVTDKGGRTSHAAIVSRELGIPCVVGTEKGTKVLKDGLVVTVNGGTGEVFKGGMVSSIKNQVSGIKGEKVLPETRAAAFLKTATKVYVNLAEPERAWEVAQKNVDGVGLLRAEFIIAQIGIHPKKLIKEGRQKIFIEKVSENLKIFCQAFLGRPVVYRTTDFKTSEYRNLVGGKAFEPEEPNPMLGFRGCFRYIKDPAVFELELEAVKRVRNKFGLKNLWLMIPFVRTPEELREVKKIIAAKNLVRSPSFKIWLMVEVPSNVILLEKFAQVGIDGVSIGSNDLTMLILGVDRDNDEVAAEFDERNEAVMWALEKVVKTCHKCSLTSSICGQAPSVYPEITEKLVEWGITSVSVNPDMIDLTREIVYTAEKRLAAKPK